MRTMRIATLALALFAGASTAAFAADAVTCRAPPPEVVPVSAPAVGQPDDGLILQYHMIWQTIKDSYYDPAKLTNWAAQEHAYDSQLVDFDHLNAAIKKMTASLGDKWTNYISPADVAAMAQRANDGLYDSGVAVYKRHGNAYQIDVLRWGTAGYYSTLRERDIVSCVNGIAIGTLSQERADAM
ncbi:MAG: hypothetical protein ACRD3W_08705, partial [Terriglobales bacterium]